MNRLAVLSGNKIKIIAIISMFLDHFSKTLLIVLLNLYSMPRLTDGSMSMDSYNSIVEFIQTYLYGIGRIAFPLFCFLISEGFYYTKNRFRYLAFMGIFAVLSEIPFDLLIRMSVIDLSKQNVYFTLFFGVLALWVVDMDIKKSPIPRYIVKVILVMGIAFSANFLKTDYDAKGVLYIMVLYLFREKRLVQVGIFLVAYALLTKHIPSVFIVLSAFIMLMYNGERGTLKVNKYIFYAFYPIHLLILWAAVRLLS